MALTIFVAGVAGPSVVTAKIQSPEPGLEAAPAQLAPSRSLLIGRRDLPSEQQPFWRRKPELQKKMREERAILVSVKREDITGGRVRFAMNGAGWVSRAKDFCFSTSQEYSRLRDVSDHFRTVNFDPNTNQLFLVTEALGYQARMILKMVPVQEDWRSELQWEVVWGHFKGMKGVMGFESMGPQKTEISIQANYEAEELPLPKALVGFALEVVTQKVAEKMRNYLESSKAENRGSK